MGCMLQQLLCLGVIVAFFAFPLGAVVANCCGVGWVWQGKGAVKLALMLYYTCRCVVWLLWLAGRDVVTELAATLPMVSLHVMSGGFARGVTLRTCCVLQLDPPSIITCCTCTCLGLHV